MPMCQGYVHDESAALDAQMRDRAMEVRDQHAGGNRCEACPPAGADRICPRYMVWLPIMIRRWSDPAFRSPLLSTIAAWAI